jgi:hypothetical protein
MQSTEKSKQFDTTSTRSGRKTYFNRLLNTGLVNLGNMKDLASLLEDKERLEKLRKLEEELAALRFPIERCY